MMEEEPKKSRLAIAVLAIFALFAIAILTIYMLPTENINFSPQPKNQDFFLSPQENQEMQFYENMRFPGKEISYYVDDSCTIQKKQNMEDAFKELEEKTELSFYEVESAPEITVSCDSKNRIEGGLFIAGEGGPTNITKTENFNVILQGKILLIRGSTCPGPNVAIHELLHVLGFKHSENKNNIMYNFSRCDQEIGEDLIQKINELYQTPQLPDLKISDATISVNEEYIDIQANLVNNGLKKSNPTTLTIKNQEGDLIKSTEITSFEIGYGSQIKITNLLIRNPNTKKIVLEVEYPGQEINKNNNKIELEIST